MTKSSQQTNGFLTLCYHYIKKEKKYDPFPRILGNSEMGFKKHLVMLQKNFQMISLQNIYDFYYNNSKLNAKKFGMLITFDDGLSDHYNAAKILHKFGIKGVFFIPTCIINERTPANPMIIHYGIAIFGLAKFLQEYRKALKLHKISILKFNITFDQNLDDPWKKIEEIKDVIKYRLDNRQSRKILLTIYKNLLLKKFPNIMNKIHLTSSQIEEMIDMGHSIGVHTHSHISVGANKLNKIDFKNEMIEPKKILEEKFDVPIISFSYPFGERRDLFSTKKLLRQTKKYKLAFTVEQIINLKQNKYFELGRYQPTSSEKVLDLKRNLYNIIKESKSK